MKVWNLDAFYKGFTDPLFLEDIEKVKKLIVESTELSENYTNIDRNDVELLTNSLQLMTNVNELAYKVFGFINLNSSADTRNLDAKKYFVMIQQIFSETALSEARFQKFVANISNLEVVIESSEALKEYTFFLLETKAHSTRMMSEQEEVLAAKLTQNGSSLWNQLQRYLTSTVEVDYKDGKKTLSEIRNLAYDESQEVRKVAYEAELQTYKKIEDAVAFAIGGIKGEVNILSRLRGFESPLDQALFNSRLKKETLDSLIAAMKESLPDFRAYMKRKGELLGHKNGLPWYDMFAPMGNSNKVYSIEEAQAFILKNFASFSDDLAGLAKRAFDEEWIDYTPRAGKVGGAFCMNSHPLKQSRILTNYDGSISDIITLAHELGHAYHGDQVFNEKILNARYTMPVAETASTFCETIVKKAALKEAQTKEEKLGILEQELQDANQVIVDILGRYLFESKVFEVRTSTLPMAKQLNQMMLDAQKEAYGDGLDQNFLNSGMWVNKSHYYSGGLSFYNFPYAFGLLFAKGIYAQFVEKGKAFVPDVRKLLQYTGKMSVEDVASLVGIDVTNIDFWRSSLGVLKEDIDLFLEITK
jgi:pepF/M3 family oligoendopeptidase